MTNGEPEAFSVFFEPPQLIPMKHLEEGAEKDNENSWKDRVVGGECLVGENILILQDVANHAAKIDDHDSRPDEPSPVSNFITLDHVPDVLDAFN